MMGRMAIVALAIGLASCAGLEPAGRNADRAPRPTATAPTPAPRAAPPPPQTSAPVVTPAPTPTPAQTQVAPPPQRTAPVATATPAPTPPPARQQAPVAAPQVSVPTPAPQPARAQSDDDDIVVRGAVDSQVPAPEGDPRSNEEAWSVNRNGHSQIVSGAVS